MSISRNGKLTLPKIICLMGPTASGKSDLALSLAESFPVEIISVDSALVYSGMNIGTAKPSADELSRVPHHLINICSPETAYSAGAFLRDAAEAIDQIQAKGKVPLLVGGTMLYYRHLFNGTPDLPQSNAQVRAEVDAKAKKLGWKQLHSELALIDPRAAKRIHPNDPQRIQRALEVFYLSGQTLSDWHDQVLPPKYSPLQLVIESPDRTLLHGRIEDRLKQMFSLGFVDEVVALRKQYQLNLDLPSMRCVGYRQVWEYLEGIYDHEAMRYRALVATRQLAKRQCTWLRQWPDKNTLLMGDSHLLSYSKNLIDDFIS
jgi:tRNA dimethylallyltransferase